ncbi:related to integral membrane protein PTH11 [Cephalotrichum gorgonifer]|uniref:Related to integral membrane protein PTH11 n=1 Tax=Cephalotrichum gorgonifer TaxID=2041049 RepID=A0AAE8N169_9PEZI|nr:related to integral membrane protein PTH11 [Cephalotrichum gorgonifer]
MDGIGASSPAPGGTMGMNGSPVGTMAYAKGVPDATSARQNVALFILFFFPALALVTVSLRAAGRWAWRQFGWDDTLICVAMFMSALETAASYKFIKTNYIGIRGRDVPQHDPTEGMIWNYTVQILYNPILALVKLSVLVFLYRLFAQKRGVKTCVVALAVATALQALAVAGAIVFQCTPISFNWRPMMAGGRCVDQRALYVSTAAFTIVTDVLVLLIPGYIFRDLKIPRKAKIALLFVFLLGGLVTAASIARLITLTVGLYNLVPDDDVPSASIGFVTSAVETNLALITASAPAMLPLLRTWFPSLFGSNGGSKSSSGTPAAPILRSVKNETDSEGGLSRSLSAPSVPDVPKRYN